MGGTAISKFTMANGLMVEINCHDGNMHMVFYIQSREPPSKLRLQATQLACGIEDLHWIVHFPESSLCLVLQHPHDSFDYTHNFDNHWVVDGSCMSGNQLSARFTPGADPYKKAPKFESLVHGITISWDAYMLP